MIGFNPLGLAALIVAVVSLAGMILFIVRNHRKFAGFEDVAKDAHGLAKRIKGEIFRDGPDLVISGNYENLPTIIRLSHSENTPGLTIDVKVPAKFKFSLTPKQSGVVPEGNNVNVSNLSANFFGRTDSPLEASQLIASSAARKSLSAICWSSKVFLELTPGRLLISELLIPASLHDRANDILASATSLSAQLDKFTGKDVRKIQVIKHDRTSWVFRGALAAGILVTIAGVAQNALNASNHAAPAAQKIESSSIPKNDAILISRVNMWREAEASDFDGDFTAWLQGYGIKPSSVVELNSDKSRVRDGKAYFLVNDKNQKRVVAIVDHRVVFDAVLDSAAGLAVVPMDSADKIQWPMSKAPYTTVPSDGLMIVRNTNQQNGANLLYFAENNVYSGIPENYQHLDLQ